MGEVENQQVLKDASMLKRLNDIMAFSKEDREHIIYTLDAMIKSIKISSL